MIEAWSGHRPSLERVATEEASGLDLDGRGAGHLVASATQEGDARAASSGQKSSATTAAATAAARGRLLLAAGRGVYGHSVLTTNSDLGNQVLIEIDSGPLRKARISGTFQMKSDRLIVKFNKLMIGDRDPIAVSAYAVSPQTAETGVASDVREHLATRIILPAAAAFVQGLGNAMMSANTTSYTGGYGMTAFTHLNLAQQMGAAAGSMGQEVGQLLQKQTPQQATVYLRQNDEVGVLFDEPVYGS
ncbi:DotG/IcmE/VirB10 family protein [Acetobacter sp. TBRC 12305]|uniref:DotG/IcmE/VirB10 family protein n=1 Tax=Acetobacter garciniae TaxID=2817435 RepID=A0A939HQJ4_9PROT|nr:DotG/IcmE/VirB10 family protein [Acetobacter garciniae]MBO1326283.1 DotG/IcmE/VirB10 family protein [Acetobacter garciniae]MBX0345978.1 DotG/IcmE/VirB10 family protein [Acetobacter garciniae]